MTNDEIDQLTGAFAYAIAALDAQAADKNASLALCNKANQCWDELLTEREALLKIVRAVADGRILFGRVVDGQALVPDPLEQHEADAAFIAHAREDIPALLGERAALLAIVAQVQASNDVHGEGAKCHFCGWTPAVAGSHAPECQREQARAFLAAEAAQE